MNFIHTKKNLIFFFLSIFIILFILHYNLIIHDPFLHYDDWLIIGPLYKIHNFSDYFSAIQNGLILDIQPVRDLSHFIDIHLKLIFPYYSFHLVNLFIWYGIVFYLFKILKNFEIQNPKSNLIILLLTSWFALSPIGVSSVAWVAARKHLLSALFILICTDELTKIEKDPLYKFNYIKLIIFYILSLLSQPINILWPLWCAIYLYTKKLLHNSKLLLTILFVICIFFISINLYYFGTYYYSLGFIKFLDLTLIENFSRSILALGRYFQLVIFPYSALPMPHSETSPLNIAGIFLFFGIILFIYYKTKTNLEDRKKFLLFFSYFIISLLTIIYNNAIFCSDTYIINASLGIFLALYYLIHEYKYVSLFLLINILCFIIYNFSYVTNFKNKNTLVAYSYTKEPTLESMKGLAVNLLDGGHINEAYQLTKNENYDDLELLHIQAQSIFLNKKFNLDEKIILMSKYQKNKSILLPILYWEKNDKQKFSVELLDVLNTINFYQVWRDGETKVIAIAKALCNRSLDSYKNSCNQKLNESLTDYKQLDKSQYKKYLEELDKITPQNISKYIFNKDN